MVYAKLPKLGSTLESLRELIQNTEVWIWQV